MRGLFRYAAAVLVFGLLAAAGAQALPQDGPALAVPFLITGVAGAGGAAVIAVALHKGLHPRVQRITRLAMAVAAVAVAVTGVVFAPGGMDRGFVIGTAALLAVLLAAFAALAGP